MGVRQITEDEKKQVIDNQKDSEGVLHCFISGEVINPEKDEIEFDHVIAYAYDGPSDIINVKVVKKIYNRRKKDQTLFDVRDLFQLERLFEDKKNNVKLQDIMNFKKIIHKSVSIEVKNQLIEITDGVKKLSFQLFHDEQLNVDYFYGQIPVEWLANDDEKGLQPRVIDKKRLWELKKHLKKHPQLAPAVSRFKDNTVYLFDGQHKTAAQLLNDKQNVDCKVYISPREDADAKKLFEALMTTNLDAHSKLRQVPFYTSTLVERFSAIYKDCWEEYTEKVDQSLHSEDNFKEYLIKTNNLPKEQVKKMMTSMIQQAALEKNKLSEYVSEASKDTDHPISLDILSKAVFPHCLYLNPSKAIFDSARDYRRTEADNFSKLCEELVEASYLKDWTPKKTDDISQEQKRARRIWHKASVLTWGPMLKDIIINCCNISLEEEREQLLYRPSITKDQVDRLKACFKRIFDNTLWLSPDKDIDAKLTTSTKQDELFNQYGITKYYVVTGNKG